MHTFRNIQIIFIILFLTVACDGVDLFDSKGSSSKNSVTVSFDVHGGTLSSPDKLIVKVGKLLAEPTPPTRGGYLFTEWQLDGVKYDFNTPVTKNITLVAVWEIIPPFTYTVTFNTDGGTPQPGSLSVNHGDKVSEPVVPTKAGHDFKGWEFNGAVWSFATDVVTSNILLTAKWEAVTGVTTYTVTFNTDGGTPQPRSLSVNHGDKVSEPVAPTKSGYDFKGWEFNGAVWSFATDVVTGDITLTAKWEIIVYTVTFALNGGQSTSSTTTSVNYGAKISVSTEPTKAGHDFKGWEHNGVAWDLAVDVVAGDMTLDAKWEVMTYTVTFNVDGGTPQPASLPVNYGAKISVPTEPTKAGHNFKGWEHNGVAWDLAIDVVTGDITLTAKWEVITYTVTFNVDGGTPQPASLPVNYGAKISVSTEPTKAGHNFKGWEHNGVAWDLAIDVVVGDMTLNAKWEVITYTVTFNVDGGTPQPASLSANHGDKVSEPVAPTKSGYDFKGWEFNGAVWSFATDVVTGDITLTAKWEIIVYTVTFALNGGQSTSSTTTSVNYGAKISVPTEPTKAGHDFKGWEHNGVAWGLAIDVVVGDMTLNAKWEVITYTVTFNVDGGTPQPASLPVNHGAKISVSTEPTKAGHDFKGWEHNGVAWDLAIDVVAGDMTLDAKWEVITYTVTFNVDGGTPQPGSLSVNHGDKVSEPTSPTKSGYDFKGWEHNGVAWDLAIDVVAGDMTLDAKWEVITYTVTFNVDGGTPQPASLPVNYGAKISVPTEPTKAGQDFKGWEHNGVAWDLATDVVVGDMTLDAKWEVITYTVTFNVDGGTPQPASLPVNYGDKISVPTESTKAGHDFKGWEHNGVAWDLATDVVVGDMTLDAKWEVITYTVTFNVDGGTPQPASLSVNHGDKVSEPVAPTKSGYDFKGWEHNSVAWDLAIDVVAGDMTLDAKWEVITYTVTFNVDGGTPQPASLPVNYGAKISVPTEPTKAGHDFKGWEHNSVAWDLAIDVVAGDMTLDAKWEVITYTVTFNVDGGTPQPASLPVNYGAKISVPTEPTKAGHNFKGWEHNGVAWDLAIDVVVGDMTLNAKWEVITYTVSFNVDGGTPQPASLPVNYGAKISVSTEPTKAGHDFKGWEHNSVAWDLAIDVVAGDMTLDAKWEVITVTLTNPQTFSSTKMDGAEDRIKNYALEISSPSAVIETVTTTLTNIAVAHSGRNVQLTASTYPGIITSPMVMELTVTIAGSSVPYVVDIPIHLETGEAASPYIISNEADLRAINNSSNLNGKYYELGADIELDVATNGDWVPIGSSSVPFSGGMDGKGHKISNLTINDTSADAQGLFGGVESGGTHQISNIHLEGVNIKGGDYVGGLAGHVTNATICNVTISGDIEGNQMVGMLAGYAIDSTIDASSFQGSVKGGDRVGGLLGWQYAGEISNSFSNSAVTATTGSAGGLVGDMLGASLRDSYALGDVTSGTDFNIASSSNRAGGLVGRADRSTIKNSFAEGTIVSSHTSGGLAGHLGSTYNCSYIEGNYSSGDVYGGHYAGGLVGHVLDSYTEDCYAVGDVFTMNSYSLNDPSAGGFFGRLDITKSPCEPNTKNTLLFAYGDVYSATKLAGGLFGDVNILTSMASAMPDYVAAINRRVGSKDGSNSTVGRIMGGYKSEALFTLTHEVYSSKFTKFSGATITSSVGATMVEAGGVIINGFTLPKEMNGYNEAFYKGMFNDYYRSVSLPSPTMWVFPADVAGNMRIMHEWQIVGKLSYHADDGRKQLLNGRRLKVTNPNAVTGADINYYVKDGYSIKAEVGGIEEDLQINNNIATYTPAFDSVNKDVEYIINVYDSADELAISLNERYTIVKEGELPVFPMQ